MENNEIDDEGDQRRANRLNRRGPEKSQESQARDFRINEQANDGLRFLQPRRVSGTALSRDAKTATGLGNISNNKSYMSKLRMAFPKKGGKNEGSYSNGILGPLPRLASFASFA